MNFTILGTDKFTHEYERIIKNFNWKAIQTGDTLHTASHSPMYIGDLKIIMKSGNAATLKYVPEGTPCNCCEVY